MVLAEGVLYVYFSRPNDTVPTCPSIDPVRFGPFDFVQITYQSLRVGPDGDPLAWVDRSGLWRVEGDRSETDTEWWYSDVVITDRKE